MNKKYSIIFTFLFALMFAGCSGKPAGPTMSDPEKIALLNEAATQTEIILDGLIMTQSSCQVVPLNMKLTYNNGLTPAQIQKKFHDSMSTSISTLETDITKYLMLSNKNSSVTEDMNQSLITAIPLLKNTLNAYTGDDNNLSQGNYCEVITNSRANFSSLLTNISISLQSEGGSYTPETPEKKQEKFNNEYLKDMKLEIIK